MDSRQRAECRGTGPWEGEREEPGGSPPATATPTVETPSPEEDLRVLRMRTLRRTRWRILPLVCACSYMFFTTRVEVALTASGIMRDLGINASELGFAISSFFIPYTLFQLPFSVLARRHLGFKRALVVMLLLQGALSMATAASNTLASLIVVRSVLGASMAAFIPTAQSYLASFFGKVRAK